jgi:hypothetical protein
MGLFGLITTVDSDENMSNCDFSWGLLAGSAVCELKTWFLLLAIKLVFCLSLRLFSYISWEFCEALLKDASLMNSLVRGLLKLVKSEYEMSSEIFCKVSL